LLFGLEDKLTNSEVGLEPSIQQTEVKVLRSVAYSYEIIRVQALKVQNKERWRDDVGVQRLQFSNKWIKNFFDRHNVSRRRITREKKKLLSEEKIREILTQSQALIIKHGYASVPVLNLDGTALNFGIGPTHVYIPKDADRGEQEISNVKARITGIPTVYASGNFLPVMFILKHSKSSEQSPDQTTMKAIKNLNKRARKLMSGN